MFATQVEQPAARVWKQLNPLGQLNINVFSIYVLIGHLLSRWFDCMMLQVCNPVGKRQVKAAPLCLVWTTGE